MKPINEVEYHLNQAKEGRAGGFYKTLWEAFTTADRDNKRRLVRGYPELLDVAKGYFSADEFSDMRRQAMVEKKERCFD